MISLQHSWNMSYAYFLIICTIQFVLGGIWLSAVQIDSVGEIMIGFIFIWSLGVILLTAYSVWKRFNLLSFHLTKIPHSESYRISFSTLISIFVLIIYCLTGSNSIDVSRLGLLIALIFTSKAFVNLLTRMAFQIKAYRRLHSMKRRFAV